MNQNKEKETKKIVINNLRKSIMVGGGVAGDSVQPISQSLHLSNNQHAQIPTANSNASNSNNNNSNSNKDLAKVMEQLVHYREKHDQSLIKVRFLTDKLESYGGLNSIPDTIINQISQTDLKIKNLEELLLFKRSKQMKKLRGKVLKFVQMLEFQLTEEDINKIEDQIEIVFFLMDIFTERYNHVMAEKAEIDHIIQGLKEDTVFTREKLEEENKYLKEKNTEHVQYIRDLEIEVFSLKKQNHNNNLGRVNYNIETLLRSPSTYTTTHRNSSKIYQETIHSLQVQNQELIAKANKLENIIKNNEYDMIRLKSKAEECEILLEKEKNKCKDLEEEFRKVQRQEVRWKERYELMERQKNQRIELLEREKKAMEGINNGYTNFQKKMGPGGDNAQGGEKRGHINLRRRAGPDKYQISDEIMEDSGQEYYDVAGI